MDDTGKSAIKGWCVCDPLPAPDPYIQYRFSVCVRVEICGFSVGYELSSCGLGMGSAFQPMQGPTRHILFIL